MKAKFKPAYIEDRARNARTSLHLCKRKQNYEAEELQRNNINQDINHQNIFPVDRNIFSSSELRSKVLVKVQQQNLRDDISLQGNRMNLRFSVMTTWQRWSRNDYNEKNCKEQKCRGFSKVCFMFPHTHR